MKEAVYRHYYKKLKRLLRGRGVPAYVSYPKIKKTGVTLISPDIETPGKWRTTHFLRQKVLGKNQAGFLDKSDYAKGALVPHSHNTHDTLADAYDDARATRGSTARFTKKNIFSAKLRLRELAGKFTTENTENTEGRK